MFGLKPPLYYLPGKRAVRLPPRSRAAPARLDPPSLPPSLLPCLSLRCAPLGPEAGSGGGLAGGRAVSAAPPARPAGCVARARGAPGPGARRCASRSFCLLGAGGAAARRGRALRLAGRIRRRCEVTFTRPRVGGAPPTHPAPAPGRPSSRRGPRAALAPPPLPPGFPGRFCSPSPGRGAGAGGASRGFLFPPPSCALTAATLQLSVSGPAARSARGEGRGRGGGRARSGESLLSFQVWTWKP
jgi:hypothetical protein